MGAMTFVSRNLASLTLFSSPTRRQQATGQTHTAGNLLVALVTYLGDVIDTPPLSTITNTAGDQWLRTTLTPLDDYPSGAHVFETWYVLATKGASNDKITIMFPAGGDPGGTVDKVLTVYEFATDPGGVFQYLSNGDANGGMGIDTRFGNQGRIESGLIHISQPSLVIANYRSVSGANPPIWPSGVHAFSGGPVTHFDSYQFASANMQVTAAYTDSSDPQWGVYATVFYPGETPPPPGPPGCPQDLPALAGTEGPGCRQDLPAQTGTGGTGCSGDVAGVMTL